MPYTRQLPVKIGRIPSASARRGSVLLAHLGTDGSATDAKPQQLHLVFKASDVPQAQVSFDPQLPLLTFEFPCEEVAEAEINAVTSCFSPAQLVTLQDTGPKLQRYKRVLLFQTGFSSGLVPGCLVHGGDYMVVGIVLMIALAACWLVWLRFKTMQQRQFEVLSLGLHESWCRLDTQPRPGWASNQKFD